MDYFEYHFPFDKKEKPLVADLLPSFLADFGFDSFQEVSDGLLAYHPAPALDDAELLTSLSAFSFSPDLQFSKKWIKSQNWNSTWERESNKPVYYDNLCVVHSPEYTNVPALPYDILIDPKLSFGSGHHETTSLMVSRILSASIKDKSVLDMGCGTAILAILAAKMGASDVCAVDIDEWAAKNATDNFELNKIANAEVRLGGVEVLPHRSFDFVFANINRNILLEGIPYYIKCMAPGSHLFLSGFYLADVPVIDAVACPLGLKRMPDVSQKNDWVSVCYVL